MRTLIGVGAGIAFVCAVAGVTVAVAEPTTLAAEPGGKTTVACAYRDRDAVIIIEDHVDAKDMTIQQLWLASDIQVEARRLCDTGHERESLALYDRIIAMGAVLSRKAD
jgi:hypothetical protein